MSVKVKICGLTNKEDAVWAVNYGADYLGINFSKESPRHVSSASASKWVSQLPPFANVIGVFVNADQNEIVKTVEHLKLKGIQLHGDESPAAVAALRIALEGSGLPVKIIKAIRMQNEESVNAMADFKDSVDYFLLDSFVQDQPGGTGTRFNWELAVKAKDFGKPIFLAGGLNPDNVKEGVKKVGPYAVDVASGVEKSPKRKDSDKIRDFITNAKK
jgi:phosphoribosylanthranilate isomerase